MANKLGDFQRVTGSSDCCSMRFKFVELPGVAVPMSCYLMVLNLGHRDTVAVCSEQIHSAHVCETVQRHEFCTAGRRLLCQVANSVHVTDGSSDRSQLPGGHRVVTCQTHWLASNHKQGPVQSARMKASTHRTARWFLRWRLQVHQNVMPRLEALHAACHSPG
jgi:hypothetical protein